MRRAPFGRPAASDGSRLLARGPWLIGLGALLALCVLAGLYWEFGMPSPPGPQVTFRPPSKTADAGAGADQDLRNATARLAESLKSDPTNAGDWLQYARGLSTLGDWPRARDAYQHAIDLGQTAPDVYASYGEMLVLAASGIVTKAAHNAFATALASDPRNDVARYYLALADSQAGRQKQAIDAWLAVAADIPPDAPMRDEIVRRIAEAAKAGGLEMPLLPAGTARPAVPDARDIAAVAQMPKPERDTTIQTLVTLAAHLQAAPNDLDGWLRLGAAYAQLGDTNKSVDAYEHATRLKPDDIAIKLQLVDVLLGNLQKQDPLPPRAVALLQQVQAIAPDEPKVLWYLGIVASREGHRDVARRDWTRLLSLLPAGSEDSRLVNRSLAELPPN